MPITTLSRAERMRGALWGMFIGDALAMPVHWYYNIAALWQDFGQIRDYQAPKAHHPNSIMPLASTGKAGRGNQAGDNTLNLLCARVLLRSLIANGHHEPADFLQAYIRFMTEPDQHNDTYAESYHRDFFANYAKGIAPEKCAGDESHDTASIGGLVNIPLVVMANVKANDLATCNQAALTQQNLTHHSKELERHTLALSQLLFEIFNSPQPDNEQLASAAASQVGFPAAKVVEQVRAKQGSDLDVIGKLLSPACYIDQSFPSVLYLATRYHDDFENALIANTNVGGDNCHRGAVLGAILGASLGVDAIPQRWITGLTAHDAIHQEIEQFVAQFA